jgi:benzoyl-CoA 2,3-dioxygenase component B
MGNVDLNAKIPNNVGLADDRKLQKALEAWQPNFIEWWMDMGPEGFQMDQIYLRTAVDVDASGWAQFDHVQMPDYRWGIFLQPEVENRLIHFGDNIGAPVWDKVPGDYRTALRRIIVTQGDTEPASVEQQRLLGQCAPSLYDLRNLFQVNVEEGRHLWAMVYLLHKYFGRDGREEAEDMLVRRSGHVDNPRILGAFNEPINDWLSFYCFTTFTDRDGKYQLASLAESGFDPLARTCRFMLTEEAHHMFVGETGVGRVIQRTLEVMAEGKDPKDVGAIPLEIIQKYVNRWFTVSMDLFGGEDSSNAATYFAAGLKGRFREGNDPNITDHVALEGVYEEFLPGDDGAIARKEVPLRRAMNLVLRDAYRLDCERAVKTWNRLLKKGNVDFRITLPSERFHRNQGVWAGLPFNPEGEWIGHEAWERDKGQWIPTEADEAYVASLMKPCYEVGKIAGWIAPPRVGINGNAFEFEYVKFADDPYARL